MPEWKLTFFQFTLQIKKSANSGQGLVLYLLLIRFLVAVRECPPAMLHWAPAELQLLISAAQEESYNGSRRAAPQVERVPKCWPLCCAAAAHWRSGTHSGFEVNPESSAEFASSSIYDTFFDALILDFLDKINFYFSFFL